MGSSPRVRGTPTAVALYSAESGIIPACAGNTRSFSSNLFMLLDHPRVCGEHAEWDSSRAYEPGSSPRVRGTPLKMRPSALVQGIIPACAGNTGMSRPDRLLPEDHPRVCGEHARLLLRCAYIWGSSPRVRGTPCSGEIARTLGGIIPACAGNTRLSSKFPAPVRDHPRVCGEHEMLGRYTSIDEGSSPRVRGTRPAIPSLETYLGIIPACAGNTSCKSMCVKIARDHPRVCGEHPPQKTRMPAEVGSSPRVRGTQ